MATEFQPYVGPRPYERDDPAPFFGRDREADDLVSIIFSYRELLFYAQSGVGKTSLLNARVIPLLEEEGFEVLPTARVQGLIPKGIQPEEIQNLYVFNVLMSWAEQETNPRRLTQMTISEFLHNLKRPTDDEGQHLLRALIFDQFEEIFTLYQDRWNDRNEFFKQVRDALKDDNRLLRVIFTIREDYIAQLDPYAHLLPEKLRTRFRMERLRMDPALSAVTGPLRGTKRSFAKGVAEKLVEDLLKTRVETITGETIEVIGEFVEPVQLQVVCQNLWQELPPDVTEITEQHVLASGGVDRPLSGFYENAVKEAVVEAGIKENELRQWCEKWLITSNGTRNIVHRGTQFTEELPTAALDSLVAHHLLNLELRAGSYWYELTHDGFIEPIRTSNLRWKEEKVNQASLMIRQAEQSITMERYERALDESEGLATATSVGIATSSRSATGANVSEGIGTATSAGIATTTSVPLSPTDRYERALDAAKKALNLSEEAGDLQGEGLALFYIGKAYEGQKRFDEALTTYAAALEIVKQIDARELEVDLLESQGNLSFQLKEYEQAAQCFNGYIELIPYDPRGYYNRGRANRNLKKYERAIEDYNHTLELDPGYVYAFNGRGNAYYDLKEYKRALEDYDRALELDPRFVHAYNGRGLSYYDLKEYKRALEDYDRALELDPKYVDAYNNRGRVYYNLKEYERAIEDYTRALELDPKYVYAYNNKGLVYNALEQYERAIEDYNRTLELDPAYVSAYNNRGLAYYYLKEYERAIAEYTRALELDPAYANAYNNRGLAYYALEEYERAIAEYTHALELDPAYVSAYNNRGLAYYYLKEYERAIAEYTRALEQDSKDIDAYNNRGLAYYYLKEYERAIAEYTHALELDPKYANAYYNRGLAYYYLKEYERAIEDYTHVLEQDSKDIDAYNNRGNAYSTLENYEQAIEDYNRVLELDPKYVDAYNNRGLAYSNLKEYERAIAEYTHVLELDSKYVDAYYNRGLAYYDLKQYEQAIADYNRALELDSKYVNAYNGRGLAYSNLKQYEQAIEDYNRALELDSKYVYAYDNRGTAYSNLKQYEQAIEDYNRALELDSKYSNAYYGRGLTYLWLRDMKQAEIDFNLSWQLDSTNVNYGWVIEWAKICQEKPGLGTAERLEAIASNDPNDFVAFVCRGVALWIRGSFDEAIGELNQAISLNQEFEDIYFWKGVVLVYFGQDDDAFAAIEKSLELGLQPILLTPLRWLEQDRPDFYRKYAAPLLARLEI